MASTSASITREMSSESSASSNIDVGVGPAADSVASTPPTSVSDSRSMQSSKAPEDPLPPTEDSTSKRSKRARSGVGSYNLKHLADSQLQSPARGSRKASGLSGKTLVANDEHEDEEDASFGAQIGKAFSKDRKLPKASPKAKLPARAQRTSSIKNRVKNAAGQLKSVLGKRSRDMMENGKRRLGIQKDQGESPHKNKLLKELDLGKKGVLDELDLEEDFPAPVLQRPAKRAKKSSEAPLQMLAQQPLMKGPLQKTSDGKKVKKWHTEGLYVGQKADCDPAHVRPRKLQKQRPTSSGSDASTALPDKNAFKLPLPMFSYLDKEREFTIPFDVFAPSLRRGDEKPKDWYKLNRNRLVGEAKDLWEKEDRLPQSACVCHHPAPGEMGCEDDCLNRVMQYECNLENCNLMSDQCSNRPFAQLGERIKKGGSFDVGVEVVKTDKRGFGIRACRSFRPGQIIMEYTGEIISEGECQRRMREIYKDKQCYYLMELERNLVIDGTKGSMARFINHSCDPNCEVRMLKVNGTPRMAVFAGDSGVMTGEELTYDYNFDNFGESQQKCYCGAGNCRGYLGKRLNAVEMKKRAKEEAERKRKAAEAQAKAVEEEARKKKMKTERGSNWRGWIPVDDPEFKAKLREEKRLKEEAAKNSDRARRMAARTSLPAQAQASVVRKKASPKRRQSAMRQVSTAASDTDIEVNGDEVLVSKKTKQLRRPSTGSRFAEGLDLKQDDGSNDSSESQPSDRALLKKTIIEVKSPMDVPNAPTVDDEDVTVAAPNSQMTDNTNADDQADDDDEDQIVAKPKSKSRPNSWMSSVSAAANRTFASAKLKQSTLNFSKKG